MKKTRRLISTLAGVGLLFSVTSAVAANEDVPSAEGSQEAVIQIEEGQKDKEQFEFVKSVSLKPRNGELLNATREYKEGEVIVKFKPNKSIQDLGVTAQTKGLHTTESLDAALNIQVLKFDRNVASVNDILQLLNNAKDIVEYAEPNYIVKPNAVSDPYYKNLWGLKNTGQVINGVTGKAGIDIKAETAWLKTKGRTSTVIAVIDTGVDISHPDLKDNIWKNTGEVPNDGIDNDKNGYIDDVNGWNFFDGNNDVFYSADEDYHGTHVAGTIAGKANTIGVIGVAPNVKIMPLKFIGPGYGYTSDAIKAVSYAKGKGVKISNNSWGGGAYSQALYDAIKYSNSLFVASAGNDGKNNDTTPSYPASYNLSNILSVAAINNTGNLASFSNYGATSVDVAAPGVSIFSTFPVSFSYGAYGYLDGTSMAAPHVTGTAALVTAIYTYQSPTQIKDTIMKTVTKLSSLTGKTVTGGLVNAGAAVNYGVPAGVYEDTNSNLKFAGSWLKVTTSSASGGSYKVANQAGASVQLVFNGTSISYKAFKDSAHGIAKVTLDGTVYNVDLYSSTPVYKTTVFSKTGLAAGRHVLKIEWTGKIHTGAKPTATKINVDSITVK